MQRTFGWIRPALRPAQWIKSPIVPRKLLPGKSTFRAKSHRSSGQQHSTRRAAASMLAAGARAHLAAGSSLARRTARLARGAPSRAPRRLAARAMAEDAEPAHDSALRTGTCFCGAVRVEARGEPMAVSICHCVNCRKLSGAPFSAQALFDGGKVSVHRASPSADAGAVDDRRPDVTGFESSARVERFRCAACASPVYATLAKGKTCVVPLAILDAHPDLPRLRPSHHMYYASRVLDATDDLPKFVASSGRNARRWTGEADDAPPTRGEEM